MWTKIWKWVDHNKFGVICPLVGLAIWAVAFGCTPETRSPLDPARMVTATELEQDFLVWQKQQEIVMVKFEFSRQDIEQQKEEWDRFQEFLVALASGSVADLPGLLQLLLGGGFIGLFADRLRASGNIGRLKAELRYGAKNES